MTSLGGYYESVFATVGTWTKTLKLEICFLFEMSMAAWLLCLDKKQFLLSLTAKQQTAKNILNQVCAGTNVFVFACDQERVCVHGCVHVCGASV